MREMYLGLARYNRWMNERLYDEVAKLPDEERKRDRGAFFGSMHTTLNHILHADRLWLMRLTAEPHRYQSKDERGEPIPFEGLDQVLYEDFERLRAQRAQTDADIIRVLDDESVTAGQLSYQNTRGETFEHPRWWAWSHFFNHQAHHRGQVTTLLSQRGLDVGVTDLAAFLRREQASAQQQQ